MSLKDQPERRSSNCILLGSSNYTARWGYSGDLYQSYKQIPSCTQCQVLLRSSISSVDTKCENCFNWDTQNIKFFPPDDYPTDICPPEQKLKTSVITYQDLIKSVQLTNEKLNQTNSEKWSTANARQYLKVMGLNTDTVSTVLKKAKETLEVLKWRIPSIWSRNVPLDAHIDVPMHLLCLGVIKSVVILINDWAVAYKKGQMLGIACDSNLEIIKHMHISWAPAVPYSNGKLGGWVSENYLVLCKVMPWFYLRFCNNCLESTQQQQNLQLLVTTLRAMMSRIMQKETTELSIVDTHRHIKLFLNAFVKFEDSMHVLNAAPVVMPAIANNKTTKKVTKSSTNHKQNVNSKKRKAKKPVIRDVNLTNPKNSVTPVANSNIPSLSQSSGFSKHDIPKWLGKYNFLCLLNVPDILRKYGPIRNYWEGGVIGEKIIQQPKNKWRGFTKNWSKNMTMSVHQDAARKKINRRLQQYISEQSSIDDPIHNHSMDIDEESDEDMSNHDTNKHFKKYSDVAEVRQYFEERIALSAVRTDDNRIFTVTKKKQILEVGYASSTCVRWGGDYYYHLTLNDPRLLSQLEFTTFVQSIVDSCLILPVPYVTKKNHVMRQIETSMQKVGWTIVTSTWLYVNNQKEFSIPYLLNHKY